MDFLGLVFFLGSMAVFIKAAHYSTVYAAKVARVLDFSEFIVSFFIVSVISVLPESSISLFSAVGGFPEFGLGTLLGSNVADLTLVMGLVALYSSRGVQVRSRILDRGFFYAVLLLFPFILGADGGLSRADGLILMAVGVLFILNLSLEEDKSIVKKLNRVKDPSFLQNMLLLAVSIAFLLVGAHFTVTYGISLAGGLGIPPILLGLTMVSLGTCLPELFFSLDSVKTNHDDLALGDLLGTVIIDATIVLGFVSFIVPFSFDPLRVYVLGLAMFLAGVLALAFMASGHTLSKKEGILLLFFYVLFLGAELSMSPLRA